MTELALWVLGLKSNFQNFFKSRILSEASVLVLEVPNKLLRRPTYFFLRPNSIFLRLKKLLVIPSKLLEGPEFFYEAKQPFLRLKNEMSSTRHSSKVHKYF